MNAVVDHPRFRTPHFLDFEDSKIIIEEAKLLSELEKSEKPFQLPKAGNCAIPNENVDTTSSVNQSGENIVRMLATTYRKDPRRDVRI